MDWTQLQAVVAVARRRSFSAAAEELRLTQSGVSRQVQKLERELGVTLFSRRRGGVELTEAGRQVQVFADETLERRRLLLDALHRGPESVSGELRIAASTTPGEFVVPGLVARFRSLHPAVRPEVLISDSATVVDELRSGRADVGFTGARLPGRGLRYEAVSQDEVVLAVPTAHRFAGRAEIALAELADEAFVEREGGSGTLLSLRRVLAARGLRLPRHRVVMVLSTTQAIVSAVENGYGLGWVSSLALEGRKADRVVSVRISGLPIPRALFIVTAAAASPSEAAAAFIAMVRARLLEEQANRTSEAG